MSINFLKLVTEQLTKRGSKIDASGVERIKNQAQDEFKVDGEERAHLEELLSQDIFTSPEVRDKLQSFLLGLPVIEDFSNAVIGSVSGPFVDHFNDDELYLGKPDGKVTYETGLKPYTRSYLSVKEGPLRRRHGSPAPASTVLTTQELEALRETPPGSSLNLAAEAMGVTDLPDLDKVFNTSRFFDPNAASWWGQCDAWTPLSLSAEVNQLVDVDGPEGERGVWLADEFFSRAELGNLAMALADTIAEHPNAREMGDNFVSPTDMILAVQRYLGEEKVGFQADIHNDQIEGSFQVWNQPFTKAELTTTTLTGSVADGIRNVAGRDRSIPEGTRNAILNGEVTVKLVQIDGTYGKEVADDYEGESVTEDRTWNIYAITDTNGKVVKSYMAYDERFQSVAGLPTQESGGLPDFIVRPNLSFADDALHGRPNAILDRDPLGSAFRFFMGTVLMNGVSAVERKAFEQEISALPPGTISAEKSEELAKTYPTIANAFSPERWESFFGQRGLQAANFGAIW